VGPCIHTCPSFFACTRLFSNPFLLLGFLLGFFLFLSTSPLFPNGFWRVPAGSSSVESFSRRLLGFLPIFFLRFSVGPASSADHESSLSDEKLFPSIPFSLLCPLLRSPPILRLEQLVPTFFQFFTAAMTFLAYSPPPYLPFPFLPETPVITPGSRADPHTAAQRFPPLPYSLLGVLSALNLLLPAQPSTSRD